MGLILLKLFYLLWVFLYVFVVCFVWIFDINREKYNRILEVFFLIILLVCKEFGCIDCEMGLLIELMLV